MRKLYPVIHSARPRRPFRKLAEMPKKCLRCGSTFGSEAEYCPHDGSLLSSGERLADPLIGTELLEQFRVDACIGEGGMGTVYRAHQTTMGRDVAIKVLRPELASDEQSVVRFAREARLATSLDHPNLVRVFLSGRLSDGRLYIVMELLEGRSLAEELHENGPPSLERAALIIMKLCAGLSAVHEAGVVHRDVKPENVYLVERGSDPDFVKLVDFGIARMQDGLGPTTQAGKVFGTASYISPESASGEIVDRRSDIYSLGVLSYQLLAGELPFEGTSVASVLMKHVHETPPHLCARGRGAQVPVEVAEVVMQALSKEREGRPQNLAEFLDAFSEAAGNAGLLDDARKHLLRTLWGDELAAPGSHVSKLLASGPPESVPPELDDTQRVAAKIDPEEEALLSSAPKPFGTTSFDLRIDESARKSRWGAVLWAGLASIAFVLIGFVATASLRAPATSPPPDPVIEPPVDASQGLEDPSAPDVLTDLPFVGPELQREPPAPTATVETTDTPAQTSPKPKRKKRRSPKQEPSTRTTGSGSTTVVLEPDDGIDWTVPDFPTGDPMEPSGAPVVIDEPPSSTSVR